MRDRSVPGEVDFTTFRGAALHWLRLPVCQDVGLTAARDLLEANAALGEVDAMVILADGSDTHSVLGAAVLLHLWRLFRVSHSSDAPPAGQ
jgi:hypothetical protein